MSVIYIVLPLALIFVIVALIVFARSVRSGQFDDLDTPSFRILHDEEKTERERKIENDDSKRSGD